MRPTANPDRLAGMVYGAFAGDALALGLHWIYDTAELAAALDGQPLTDFRDPLPGSYHPTKKAGDQSHVGDQALVLMNSLLRGTWKPELFTKNWQAMWTDYPDYIDKATRHRLEVGTALTSTELAGAARGFPLAAMMMRESREDMFDALSEQAKLTHDSAPVRSAAWCFAEIARGLVEGETLETVLDRLPRLHVPELDLAGTLATVRAHPTDDPVAVIQKIGQSCDITKALPAVLYLLVHFGDNLEHALVLNTMAGGDNCTRGILIGMILGAAGGRESVPERWRATLTAKPEIEAFLASRAIA